MDNVINQSTVINGEKSTVITGKDLTGQTLSGTYTLIGCSGSVTVISGKFYLYNCSELVVTNQNNAATVIRDGYAIGDIYDGSDPTSMFGGSWEEITIDGDSYIIKIYSTGEIAHNEEKIFISKAISKNVKAIFTSFIDSPSSDSSAIMSNSIEAVNIISANARTTLNSGGGCISTIMVDKQSEDYTVIVKSYGYREEATPLRVTLQGFITPLKTVYKRIANPDNPNVQ